MFRFFLLARQNTDLEIDARFGKSWTSTIFTQPHDYISNIVHNRWNRAVCQSTFCPMFSLVVMLAY